MQGTGDRTETATSAPSRAQRQYLERGLGEPGGKLPLFDRNGQRIKGKTIQACMDHGWCEPWARNPIKPDWLICKLTDAGRTALGKGKKRGS
ncbi:MAG: hypothetical protein EP335_03635 [Alphaproteobacteria bacterium]|nr:MAG: hypothetical protein EP335_03635 [Alphaproteobacteria bacterium]